jgi:hexosaminidase
MYQSVSQMCVKVKAMHAGIQDLVAYNFGGDETAHDAWADSPACTSFNMSHEQLMEVFVKRVAQITQAEGLSLAGWEDGLLGDGGYPYERDSVENDEVIGVSWSNVWEWGGGNGAYRMANANYKVRSVHVVTQGQG